MSETVGLPKDSTGQTIAGYLAIMAAEAELNIAGEVNSLTWAQTAAIVKNGIAESVFAIGDQLTPTWTDALTDTSYDDPFDIVAFETVTLEDGEEVPGMILQQHYATVYALPFDEVEAFYVASAELAAGTYNVMMGTAGSSYSSGDYYQFTLTEAVPEGGFLAGFQKAQTASDVTALSVYSYDSDYTLIETVSIESGSDGTNLGTFYSTTNDGLNGLRRTAYGYSRWAQSAVRQYLNSDADAGAWWASQNDYDLPPDELDSYPGFMSGFDSDFLAILKPIKVTTALNTLEELDESEDTYDTFFLPSLEQEYVVPETEGVEGDYWPYWKQVLGLTEPQATGSSYTLENHIRYALHSQSSAQNVRLRSAYRSSANYAWYVGSTGYVNYNSAYTAYRSAPACCIC